MMKKALIQKNIWVEGGYDRFVTSLKNEFEVMEVHVIPFTENFDPEPPADYKPDIVFGSTRFVNLCRLRDYPTFPSFNPYHSYSDAEYGADAGIGLNTEHDHMKFKYLRKLEAKYFPLFAKPETEKFFTGRVLENPEDVDKLQLATSFVEDPEEEWVFIYPAKNIETEIRFFVVWNTIITASVYKVKGVPKQFRIDPTHEAWQFLAPYVDTYDMGPAYVVDLGLTDEGWKVIEFNNLNSAGIYETDTDALARAFAIAL